MAHSTPTTNPATPSSGETDLARLLATMQPRIALDASGAAAETFVFARIPHATPSSSSTRAGLTLPPLPASLPIKMLFHEAQAWTLIMPLSAAEALAGQQPELGLSWEFACAEIVLEVHSSLAAVGFLARITAALAAELGIGVNPVSAGFHDHLFVPKGREGDVVRVLEGLMAEGRGKGEGG